MTSSKHFWILTFPECSAWPIDLLWACGLTYWPLWVFNLTYWPLWGSAWPIDLCESSACGWHAPWRREENDHGQGGIHLHPSDVQGRSKIPGLFGSFKSPVLILLLFVVIMWSWVLFDTHPMPLWIFVSVELLVFCWLVRIGVAVTSRRARYRQCIRIFVLCCIFLCCIRSSCSRAWLYLHAIKVFYVIHSFPSALQFVLMILLE